MEKTHSEEYFTGFNTKAVHIGNEPDPTTHAVCVPIYLSSTFEVTAEKQKYFYARLNNPTRSALEANLAALEGANHCICTSSGLAACCLIMHTLNPGDHVICCEYVYPGVRKYMMDMGSVSEGIDVEFADLSDLETFKKSLKPTTKAVWVESPGDSTYKVFDIPALAKVCNEKAIMLVVDNTTLSPYMQNPLVLGATISVHSCTNSICGHNDVLMGAIMTNDEKMNAKLRKGSILIGCTPSAFDCYMVLRGVKTLGIRLDEVQRNAMEIAKFLSTHPKVEECIYPGLESHKDHKLLKEQARGFGPMIGVRLKESGAKFCKELKWFVKANGSCGVQSAAYIPALTTYKEVAEDIQKKLGITDKLVTLSIGIEDLEDLRDDLNNALNQI